MMIKTVSTVGWSACYETPPETLGRMVSRYIGPRVEATLDSEQLVSGLDFYRVLITVTPIKDKRGRYIIRHGKRKRGIER